MSFDQVCKREQNVRRICPPKFDAKSNLASRGIFQCDRFGKLCVFPASPFQERCHAPRSYSQAPRTVVESSRHLRRTQFATATLPTSLRAKNEPSLQIPATTTHFLRLSWAPFPPSANQPTAPPARTQPATPVSERVCCKGFSQHICRMHICRVSDCRLNVCCYQQAVRTWLRTNTRRECRVFSVRIFVKLHFPVEQCAHRPGTLRWLAREGLYPLTAD